MQTSNKHRIKIIAVALHSIIAVTSLTGVVTSYFLIKEAKPPLDAHFSQTIIPLTKTNIEPAPEFVAEKMIVQNDVDTPVHEAAMSAPSILQISSSSSSSMTPAIEEVTQVTAEQVAEPTSTFLRTVYPVSQIPDWGAMKTPEEWNRTYNEMPHDIYVRLPSYNIQNLITPMEELLKTRDDPSTIALLTAKLYYSTRYFGAYDLDAGEFSAVHPGIDLKLPQGTPIGAIAGGTVHAVRSSPNSLGLHVIIEHVAPNGQTYYSIYGHLDHILINEGDIVTPGQTIGEVGMTGNTSAPHLHLQVDVSVEGQSSHSPYWPSSLPSAAQASAFTVHPIRFIQEYSDGQ